MKAKCVLRAVRVTPKQLYGHLLSHIIYGPKVNFQRSLNFVDVLNFLNLGANTTMDTENFIAICFVIYDSSQRHIFEHIVDLLEYRIGVINVLTQSGSALLPKSPVAVHVSVFVIASE